MGESGFLWKGAGGERKDPEIKRARRKWGWVAKRWESMIRCEVKFKV